MARLNIEREHELTPKRFEFALNELEKLNLEIAFKDKTKIEFIFNNNKIILFPYSGYFNGKGIKAGRGIKNLLQQLKTN